MSRLDRAVLQRLGASALVAIAAALMLCGPVSAAGDVNSASCPGNESSPGFRAYMPDCRAYELVTPPYIGGQVPFGEGRQASKLPIISANGEHLLGIVFAGFAGTENDEQSGFEYGSVYEYSRTEAGWQTESLEPPASIYPRRNFFAVSTNLSRTLWEVFLPQPGREELADLGETETVLVVRESAGDGEGKFTEIGPVVAPGHEPASLEGPRQFERVGVSADLDHVFLQVAANLKQTWPGDETLAGDVSLYEYDGTSAREPILVGVKNNGRLDGEPHVNEEAQLVSRCGTELGTRSLTPADNAVSADGEVVYFTALACAGGPPVNELYARVEGQRTVDISEPTTGPGGDCEVCDESELKAPMFEGASENGAQVFFRSEQELLPGATGDSLYEYNFDAPEHQRVSLIAPEVTAVTPPAENGERIYFESDTALATGPNANGESPQEGVSNLYVSDYDPQTETRSVAYVAREPGLIDATSDGQFAVFESAAQLDGTNDDPSTVTQLFEYDADTRTVSRVSVGQSSPTGYECPTTRKIEPGYNCDGNTTEYAAVMIEHAGYAGSFPEEATSSLSVSAGGTVAFMSGDALTPHAVPGGENIYEYRANNVFLVSPGDEAVSVQDNERSRFKGIDESGRDIFFKTTDSLVPQDVDTQGSFYDAREDGGFPGPGSAPSCQGELCQGAVSAAPGLVSPSVATPGDNGNLAAVPGALPSPAKPKTAAKIKAEKLTKALRTCRLVRDKRRRAACEAQARRKYGPTKARKRGK